MTREARKLVTAIRDAADKYLAAENHAEKYIYGIEFARALMAYNDHAQAAHRKVSAA